VEQGKPAPEAIEDIRNSADTCYPFYRLFTVGFVDPMHRQQKLCVNDFSPVLVKCPVVRFYFDRDGFVWHQPKEKFLSAEVTCARCLKVGDIPIYEAFFYFRKLYVVPQS